LVWCGDFSFDRGSGAVPAFLAAQLGVGQALGLVHVERDEHGRGLEVTRRLDGGRREVLRVGGRAVLSVEGASARLRRAPLPGLRADVRIEVRDWIAAEPDAISSVTTVPFRPRARVLPAPRGGTALERIKALTSAPGLASHGETVDLDPPHAAERILDAL